MLVKKGTRHGRMAAPAKEAHISPESYIIRPIHCRVKLYLMAHKAYWLVIHHQDITSNVKHIVRINSAITSSVMTPEAALPAIGIRTSSQELRCSFPAGTSVNFMTGEAPYPASEQGHRESG